MTQALIRKGTLNDSEQVYTLVEQVKTELLRQNILQWDESYPNEFYLKHSLLEEEMFVVEESGIIVGIVVVNEWQSPEWNEIPWIKREGNTLIIHTLCVNPRSQGKGIGKHLLSFCEEFARVNGYGSIRLDVFPGNPIAEALYVRNGYQKRGTVTFLSKPIGHQLYHCYEKCL